MTSTRGETKRLEAIRKTERSMESRARAAKTREANRERRNADALERELVGDRRERLREFLEFCEEHAPHYEWQAEQLRAGLAELPSEPSPKDALTWAEFRTEAT